MNHDHHHQHHHHSHAPAKFNRAFAIGTVLNVGFILVEVTYGYLAHSLALFADAGHNLGDVLGLLLAWGASAIARRPPTARYTYGLRGSSILAAVTNAVILLLSMGAIAWEAIQRFNDPVPVAGGTVITVAVVGVIINSATALMFMSGRKTDLNIRGAFLHMAADALISFGVVLVGIAILVTKWVWLDPIVSLVLVVVVVAGTWQLLRESVSLALDAVPMEIEPLAVKTYLLERPGVLKIHDLHIWAMSTTETALTVHLVMPNGYPGDSFLWEVCHELQEHFGIKHSTIQIEIGDSEHSCVLEPDHVV
ncbi:cation diffusion facilitator family transporter [Anabaena cylindrica UHCC 0172]|uniref:cation diffusion facilitator family transporter n=1 Tax=Anabaena cylindrica TaxID=1165 RepID=UPI002B215C7B|nr:cation diffusion facilitator family transporter [Anabaena cylindrica]MEA5549695.1 cation diffusion facilitator family transporter [Anabaena cylindrica UHCC 0172]